ncbi:hypothetical protein JIN84_10615 [Luteolibacter yonseiensis]|uniref:Alpha-2-macroglobulin n=1 Tax=Luteolibacter yonseiensis TaxID=1144680 RepID=A0A934VBE6_9BACT|nr:MG2 domain-containing protein [Luteolibacter yonseiensis]MBK1816065.1 hypothetical protein [Luteolibacter yonseiensis]
MKPITSAILAILAIPMAASAAPRLVVSTPSLAPESQIDLVLDSPVMAVSDIGKNVDNTWIDIQPALPGRLLWKAPNIASFIPGQPPAIGTKYTFSISENHHYLDGTPVPAGTFATAGSEAFRIVVAFAVNRWHEDYSPSTGEWVIVFNDAVDPSAAINHISFTSKNGQRVSAKLARGTAAQAGYYGRNNRSWAARFPGSPIPEITPETPLDNVVVASPATPLPVGEGWVLSVFNGVPNSGATARLPDDSTHGIGDVKPFEVARIEPYQTPGEPRQIRIVFNQPVPASLPVDFLAKCIEMYPRPENLSATPDGKVITLTGDFDQLKKCKVTFRPPYTSAAGLDLAGPLNKEIEFGNFIPVVSFPSQDQAQLANGTRGYRMLTLNLESARLRVKRLTGVDQIRAFQGYRHVSGNGPDHTAIEPTITIPYPLINGETVVDKEIPLETPIDTTKIVTLKWDDLLPQGQRTGTFFVEAAGTVLPDYEGNGTAPTAQSIIQLTDIGLSWKLTSGEAFIYAFSCDTGAPLPGVKVEVFGEDAVAMLSATTDAAGIATLPRDKAARHLRASIGNDTYLTAFDSSLETVGLWHFPIRYSWNKSPESARKVFLFSDRSLYRPGETARVKGIVRSQSGNTMEPADSAPARIVVIDPTEKELHTSPVILSANGSFDFTWQIPEGKVGSYTIRLEYPEELAKAEEIEDDWEARQAIAGNASFVLPLRVEEFRRNAFEITQTIATPGLGAGSVPVDLSAKYYQGQPVAGGGVKHFSRVVARNLYPERFSDYLFGNHRVDDWSYWYHYFGYRSDDEGDSGNQATQIQGETRLGADGRARIITQIPQAEFPTARELTISSEVTDANNQTLTSTSEAIIHPASVYVGVSRTDKLVRAGDTVALKLVATDTEGEPYPGAVKVTATLSREVNSAVKSRTDSGATATRNDVSEEIITTAELTLDPAASAGQGTAFNVTPKANGRHFLTVSGTDPGGRKFSTVTYFNVYGTEEYPWLYEDGLRVKLVAEKKSYKPGETARVLVLSPIEGTALVTVEREKVLRSFQVRLKADKPVIEIPLTDDDAPNAYVSVLIVKGAKESAREHKEPQLRLGYCELTVENLRDRLAVSLSEPEKSYRPGGEVALSGSVRLSTGAPAAGAEVTLYAEDEGTLAVMGYETPRPLDYFYTPRELDVETGTSFQTFISEDPEQQVFHNKGFFIGGGGDMSKLADRMRKNFDPCATWAPAILTDEAGNFSHRFKVPDTLTRYRVIAIAHHQVARFGHAESGIVVKKDLMLEPKAPRFANQSDTFNPQVLVQNASDHTGTWEIKFGTGGGSETPCVTATGNTSQLVTLAPGTSTTVVFPARADGTGEAVLNWTATPVSIEGGQLTEPVRLRLSDAVETRFPVHYPMPLLRQTKLVKLGAKQNLRDQLDSNLLDGTGTIELGFSRSPLVEAAGSIDFLLSYPHGCVEQTTSSLMPWFAVEDLKSVVPRFAAIPEQKIHAAIQAGADRLLSMQLADGSFAYWPGATESAPWATAYAGLGLIMAAEKGANVPESATASLVRNLTESLRGIAEVKSPDLLEGHTRALLVLALAGEPQTAYRNVLVDRLADLTPSARYLLATAIAVEDEGNEENLAVAKSVITSGVPFKLEEDGWMPYPATEAYRLIAWLAVEPDGPEPGKALERMLGQRNPYGQWKTTWANGWSLMAMAAFAAHENLADTPVTLTLDTDKGTETISLASESPVATRGFALAPELKLDLTSGSGGYVRMNVAAKPKIVPLQPVSRNGLSIDRTYERIKGDGSAEVLTEPRVGDLVRVTLRVTLPQDETRYLVIEDALPGLFEAVNTDFKSQGPAIGTPTSENDWRVSHSELRTDRAVFYLDHIWRKGTYTLTYLARCTVSGQATAPPAKVEEMYDPENFALSASRVFTTD